MTVDEIRAAIAADPAVRALLPATGPVSQAQIEAVWSALSAGRKRLQTRQISERGILAALGPAVGGAFLTALESFAAATLPAEHPLAASHAGIARAIRWLRDAEGIDVGDASTQEMLAAFAALGVTDPAATAVVQALGWVADPLPLELVRWAILNDDQTMAV